MTDGVTIRAAKYVTGNFVPVVGKMFADATDTVISASLLVKNSIGLAGVIIILFLCAFPAIKILTLALIYNIAAAVMQPLETPRSAPACETIGKTMLAFYSLGRSQYDVLPGHNDSAHGRQHYRHDEVRQNIEGGQCLGGMANGLAWRLVEKRHHGGSLCSLR